MRDYINFNIHVYIFIMKLPLYIGMSVVRITTVIKMYIYYDKINKLKL
jgi:hypothetical protein